MGRTFTNFVPKDSRDEAMKLCLVGATGKLGKAIATAAIEENALLSVSLSSGDDFASTTEPFDVIVDASRPEGTERATELAVNKGVAIVVCTTGLREPQHEALQRAAQSIPVLMAPNTSFGVAIVRQAVEAIAAMTKEWAVEISETHHKNKFDKPSGTAHFLADGIDSARSTPIDRSAINSHRCGDVIGEHVVSFASSDETISVEHRALDRAVFGRGAVRAARWLVAQQPGLYTIQDTLE